MCIFQAGMHDLSRIWQSFKEGSWDAYSTLYNQHFSLLYNYGYKFTKNTDLIEDCVHDLFTKLWSDKSRLGEPASVKNYLYKAFRNIILDKLKMVHEYDNLSEDYAFHYETGYDLVITSKEQDDELRAQMHRIIEQLPVRQKEIIFLRFYEGMDYKEIADVMAITISSSYKLLYKAIAGLQELMNVSKMAVIFHLFGVFYLNPHQQKIIF